MGYSMIIIIWQYLFSHQNCNLHQFLVIHLETQLILYLGKQSMKHTKAFFPGHWERPKNHHFLPFLCCLDLVWSCSFLVLDFNCPAQFPKVSIFLSTNPHQQPKGQVISKANFEVFIWTTKRAKIFLYFCPSLLNGSNHKNNGSLSC